LKIFILLYCSPAEVCTEENQFGFCREKATKPPEIKLKNIAAQNLHVLKVFSIHGCYFFSQPYFILFQFSSTERENCSLWDLFFSGLTHLNRERCAALYTIPCALRVVTKKKTAAALSLEHKHTDLVIPQHQQRFCCRDWFLSTKNSKI